MKSRLHLLVVLLFIGTAGVIFLLSGKSSEPASDLEIVEDVGESETDFETKSSASFAKVSQKENKAKFENVNDEKKPDEPRKIFVHVCGAVRKEGVYQVEGNARVVDAIKAAGGLTGKAASYGINQAEVLKDGMQIYVPTKKEVSKAGTPGLTLKNSVLTGENSNNTVNINTATKEELMKLNGVGEARAELIITYRETNGGFKDITDLMKIKGIKQKFFDKIKDNICI
nr:helix-hairpin-helix domain-containing protein [uncultured Catonella sp.]